jgi:hypothetical protein
MGFEQRSQGFKNHPRYSNVSKIAKALFLSHWLLNMLDCCSHVYSGEGSKMLTCYFTVHILQAIPQPQYAPLASCI